MLPQPSTPSACQSLLLLKGLIGNDFCNTIKTLVIDDFVLESYKALAIRLTWLKVLRHLIINYGPIGTEGLARDPIADSPIRSKKQ